MLSPPRALMRNRRVERWVSTIWRDWARLVRPRWAVETRIGRRLLIDQECPVGRGMLTRGLWEHRQFAFLDRAIPERARGRPAVFLDVGAYWGLYAIYFAANPGIERLVCIEPLPRNAAHLRLHLMMNGLEDRIELIESAVSDTPGELRMIARHGGGSRLAGPGEAGDVAVPVARLDDLLDISGRFIVMKMDLEGHEARALEGMRRLAARNDLLLQIEIFPENEAEVKPRLRSLGLTEIHRMDAEHFYASEGTSEAAETDGDRGAPST